MPKERNVYQIGIVYRGQQVWKQTWATSNAEAARKLDVSPSHLKNYGHKFRRERDVEFEGCQGFLDSGWIIFDMGRSELRNLMPYEELTRIINECVAEKYKNSPFGS
jgi:hypothetical protein